MKKTNSRLPLKPREPLGLTWGTSRREVESLGIRTCLPYQPDPHPKLTPYLSVREDGVASESLPLLVEVIPAGEGNSRLDSYLLTRTNSV